MIKDTQTDTNGYPLYRRRDEEIGGQFTYLMMKKKRIKINNGWIVPYSPLLTKIFNAHINAEFCKSVKSIKYICNYINKGSDMAVIEISKEDEINDEITQFQLGRYISSNEAVWRILGFSVHERFPTITHLAVHLENGQRVYFNESNAAEKAKNPEDTTLTAFFKLCEKDSFAKTLFYHEVPKYFTWNKTKKEFNRRKYGMSVAKYPDIRYTNALGRVFTVHPNHDECFFIRMLLHNIKGPTSFQSLKNVN